MDLYHFTCHHGRAEIGETGHLRPGAALAHKPVPLASRFVWLTDLDVPMRDALGLTAHLLECDRGQHRYRVTDDRFVASWMDMREVLRQGASRTIVDLLESAPGALPQHWWISVRPVPVVLDPLASHGPS